MERSPGFEENEDLTVEHLIEYPEESPKLTVYIGGTDPALHQVVALHCSLWSGEYGDRSIEASGLWSHYQRFLDNSHKSL